MKKMFTLLLLFAAWLPLGADAADLQVRVFERGGNVPLQGVAVCLGTNARLDQFGAVHTDNEGYALFSELPQAQVLVTASMPGYKSEQENMVTSNLNRMLVLSLSSGGGGASCPVSRKETGLSSAALAIKRFAINDGVSVTTNRTVRLHNKLAGMATQYRASERQDMADAEWQYYAVAPEFTLSPGTGLKRVYLQVRRHSTVNGATLESVSPIVKDSIRLN